MISEHGQATRRRYTRPVSQLRHGDDSPHGPRPCRENENESAKPAIELVSEVQDYNDIRIMGAIEDRIMLSTSNLTQMDAVLITTFVLPNTSETSSRRNAALRALARERPGG